MEWKLECHCETPNGLLRFYGKGKHRRLQQSWTITTYIDGQAQCMTQVWRDIPEVTEDRKEN